MMRVFLSLFLSLFLFSCGEHRKRVFIDPELKQFTDSFLLAAKIRGQEITFSNIIIRLDDLSKYSSDSSRIGGCFYNRSSKGFSGLDDYDDANIVIIDSKFFYNPAITDYNRRDVMFHELGHCVLGRKHDTRNYKGVPSSLMNPYLVSLTIAPFFYVPLESSYFDEMFKIKDSAVDNDNFVSIFMTPNPMTSSMELDSQSQTSFLSSQTGCVSE